MAYHLKPETQLTRAVLRILQLPETKREEMSEKIAEVEGRLLKRDFRPTLGQHNYLEALMAASPDERVNKAALARKAGVSYARVINWHKREVFRDWLAAAFERVAEDRLAVVWKAVYDKAVGGGPQSVSAAKLFVERFDGQYKPTVKNETDVTHHLPELSSEERGRLESARQNFNRLLENTQGETNVQGVAVAKIRADGDDQERPVSAAAEVIDGELLDGGGGPEAV